MIHIWVTGASGQVGKQIQDLIKAHSLWQARFFSRQDFDLTNETMQQDWFLRERPDCVLNLAAYTRVDQAELEPDVAYAVNTQGVKILAQLCAKYAVPIIHVSTDYVFSGEATAPYLETASVEPKSVYGYTKAQGEAYLRLAQPEHVIVRTSWVYSAEDASFVSKILRVGQAKRRVSVVSDQIGCPTAACNLALVLCQVVQAVLDGLVVFGTYHYRDDETHSWFSFAQTIFAMLSAQDKYWREIEVVPILSVAYPTLANRPKYSVLSVDQIRKNFGISTLPTQHVLPKVLQQLIERKSIQNPQHTLGVDGYF